MAELILADAASELSDSTLPQIDRIIHNTRPDRQTLMWSATWPKEVIQMSRDFLTNPYQVTIGSLDTKANKNVKQIVEVMEEYDGSFSGDELEEEDE